MKQADDVGQAGMVLLAIGDALKRFPAVFCEQVIDPVDGLPGTQKYPLRPNDVVEALKAAQARHNRMLGNALWAKRRHDERAKEAAEDARLAAERAAMTPEKREKVNALVAALKLKTMGEAA